MTGSGAAEREPVLDASDEDTIEVIEENLRVGKRDSRAGPSAGALLRCRDPGRGGCRLRDETVHLERRPVDRAVGGWRAFVDRTIEATETSRGGGSLERGAGHRGNQPGKGGRLPYRDLRDTVRHTEVEVEDDRLDRDQVSAGSTVARVHLAPGLQPVCLRKFPMISLGRHPRGDPGEARTRGPEGVDICSSG